MAWVGDCRRKLLGWLVRVASLCLSSAALEGQSVIRGALFDSLRAQGPVAGAMVVLLRSGLRATTDADGRFTFQGAVADTDTVAYWAPWLDSLGVPPVKQPLRIVSGRLDTVSLATPSLETLLARHCGFPLDRTQAAVIGELTDEVGHPLIGWQVVATWTDVTVDGTRIAEWRFATADTTTVAGHWRLCGLSSEATATVVATGPSGDTLTQSLQVHSRLLRRDLVHGREGEQVVIRGRITDRESVGVANARIAVGTSDSAVAISDADGRFVTSSLPARSTDVVIRAIGFAPTRLPVTPLRSPVDLGDVVLAEAPYRLEARQIIGGPYAHERREFEERRSVGLGFFITEEMLRHVPLVTPAVVLGLTPRVRVAGDQLRLRQGSGVCTPRFFIDGIDTGLLLMPREQSDLLQRARRVEIYTAAQAPPRFNDFDGCGSIVVWTR